MFSKHSKVHRLFFCFLIFSALFEVASIYVGRVFNNNLWMFRLFLICDFLFFIWYYHRVYEKPLWDFRFNLLPLLLITVHELVPEKLWLLSSSVSWFHLLIFIFFIVQSMYAMVRSFEAYQEGLLGAPVYWVSFARFLYFMLIVFAYILPEFSLFGKASPNLTFASTFINNFSNICLNVLYAFSFLCLRMTSR